MAFDIHDFFEKIAKIDKLNKEKVAKAKQQ